MKASLWLLLVLFFLTSHYLPSSTYAQSQPPTDSIRLQVRSAGDTLIAIHQLFLSKRRSAKAGIWTGVGLTAVGVLMAQGSHALVNSVKQSTSGQPLKEGAASLSLKFSLPGLALTTLGLIRQIRFNRRREAVVISAYEQGKVLPPFIQRLVRSQHFANQ